MLEKATQGGTYIEKGLNLCVGFKLVYKLGGLFKTIHILSVYFKKRHKLANYRKRNMSENQFN